MNIITPAWFDVPDYKWEELPENARIAARWVHAGAKVFPCYAHVFEDSRGNVHDVKTPKTPNGFKDASEWLPAVLSWWTHNPEDLVGVSCEDRLLVIDIDMDSDKDEPVDGWASLNDAGLSVPEDFMIVTPRGGNHAYCRPPVGTAANSVKDLRLEDGTVLHGVDRRGLGGYVIGWVEAGIPESIEDLPFAPIGYCHVYSGLSQGVEYTKTTDEWLATIGAGKPTGLMKEARKSIPRGKFGHDAMRDLQRHIIGLGAEGHSGAALVIDELRSEFLRPPFNTLPWEADFNAALAGGVKKYGGVLDGGGESDARTSGQKSVAMEALALAQQLYDFHLAEEGDVLAVPRSGPKLAFSMDGKKEFFPRFSTVYKDTYRRTLPEKAYKEMASTIYGECQETPTVKAALRVAEHEGSIFVDMGDETGRCIKLNSLGWAIEQTSSVLFRRTQLIAPLVEPVRGGSLTGYFDLLNLPLDRGVRAVYLGFLVSYYFPNISHPLLYVKGAMGSAKSKVTEFTHRLLDPSPVVNRKLPRKMHDWIVTAQASYFISMDNLSHLYEEMSNALCRAVTGDADVVRSLYTNRGVEVFSFRRVIAMNGIDITGIRGDLADRVVLLELPVIHPTMRRTDEDLYATFSLVSGEALGALLDAVVQVMAVLPHINLAESPRMADFARILAALDEAYGDLGALNEYLEHLKRAAVNFISSDVVLEAIKDAITEPWEGTAKDLLGILNSVKPWDDSRKYFPQTPRQVTRTLAESAPIFSKIGIKIEDLGSKNRDKVKRFRITPPEPWRPITLNADGVEANLFSAH